MQTVWEKIVDAISNHNIEVYPPATKKGECKKEYVVVKQDGSSQYQDFSSEAHYYTLLLYVPQFEYASLEKFKEEVKAIVATDLYPVLMPTGNETPDYYDETFKAHMVSIMYRNNVRNKQL